VDFDAHKDNNGEEKELVGLQMMSCAFGVVVKMEGRLGMRVECFG
jgi:hypothetical protein